MSEDGRTVEPDVKQWGGISKYEWIGSIPIVGVLAVYFVLYIFRGVGEALPELDGRRIALFFVLVVAALWLGRLRETQKRFFGGVAVFFGLGALWDAVAHFYLVPTLHGANAEWSRVGLVVVAALVVAEGWSMLRTKRPTGTADQGEPIPPSRDRQ